jgi:protein-tyrosine phosphatase
MKERRSILFVCTGNICRSPTAEGVLKNLCSKAGIELRIESAGLGDWHVGDPPDERAQHHARSRGYDLSAQRARQVRAGDFEDFDMILAMDHGHLRALLGMAPRRHHAKIRLFALDREVPDPYHGGPAGFELVLDLVEERCRALIAELRHSPIPPIS